MEINANVQPSIEQKKDSPSKTKEVLGKVSEKAKEYAKKTGQAVEYTSGRLTEMGVGMVALALITTLTGSFLYTLLATFVAWVLAHIINRLVNGLSFREALHIPAAKVAAPVAAAA